MNVEYRNCFIDAISEKLSDVHKSSLHHRKDENKKPSQSHAGALLHVCLLVLLHALLSNTNHS